MRHGQRLTYDELRAEAEAAFKASGMKQKALAARFDVSQAAISQALNNAGGRYAALQARILEELTPYTVEEEVEVSFRVQRQA